MQTYVIYVDVCSQYKFADKNYYAGYFCQW